MSGLGREKLGCMSHGVLPLNGRENLWLGLGVPRSTFLGDSALGYLGAREKKRLGGWQGRPRDEDGWVGGGR